MKKLSKAFQSAISAILEDEKDPRAKNKLNNLFWQELESMVLKIIDGGKNAFEPSANEKLWFDLGYITDSLLEETNRPTHPEVTGSGVPSPDYYYFSRWLATQYEFILKNDQKGEIKSKISIQKKRLKALEKEIEMLQKNREQVFREEYEKALSSRARFDSGIFNRAVTQINNAKETDLIFKEVESTKNQVMHGKFLNPDKKRAFIMLQESLKKKRETENQVINAIGDAKPVNHIREVNGNIDAGILDLLKKQRELKKSRSELKELKDEVSKLSAIEIENAISKVLVYNREMVKLCAKRQRTEPFSVINSNRRPLSLKAIDEVMGTVLAFDPKLFKNDRIRISGKPSVVIVPGYGDGTFDWKYNALVIPTMPYRSYDVSVFSAVVEYKLDCDEDKVLLTSFNKLKEFSSIRSTFQLKEKFKKNYVAFMSHETKGYKVLPKNIRQWFEREIAPNKNGIRVPLDLDPSTMSRDEYNKNLKEVQERVDSGNADSKDHFFMGIVHEYNAEDQESLNQFIQCVILDNKDLQAIYNVGIMAVRLKEKELAVKFFSRHMALQPQGWWSAACRDQLVRLR